MKLFTFFSTCFLFLFTSTLVSQEKINTTTNDLNNKTASELLAIAVKRPTISILKKTIKKAKEENDLETLTDSYYFMNIFAKDEEKLLYNDSIIALKDVYHSSISPANAYYSKGFYFFNKRDFIKATDNFIKANEYANKYYNKDIIIRSKQSLGLLKKEIGDYKQALTLYKENYNYIASKDSVLLRSNHYSNEYLEIIFSIASVYNELHQTDSLFFYNNLGLRESFRLKKVNKYNDFILNEAKVFFDTKKYDHSLLNLNKVLPYYEASKDNANLSVTYYYLAKNYLELKEEQKAIALLKKVDSIYQISNDTRPKTKLLESYKALVFYYKEKNQLENLTLYQDKMIALVNKLHENELYLNKKIAYDYDIPVILAKNKKVVEEINAKKERTVRIAYILVVIIISILIILFHLNSRRKVYKKRFEELMNKKQNSSVKNNPKENAPQKTRLNIPDEVVTKILDQLDKFEKNKGFLNSKISVATLAKSIGTNPNYLSKTVNYFKKMSFSQYVNTLRITYAVDSLKSDSIYRKYTLKAIAAEFGFNNTESYSKAFYKETGIKPSYFMKNLEKIST